MPVNIFYLFFTEAGRHEFNHGGFEMKSKFSENDFWRKISSFFSTMGEELVVLALTLFYVADSQDTPLWVKTGIYSALLYLISPVDAIPDFLPGGFVDDLAVLGTALVAAQAYVTDEIKAKARRRAAAWFS